ncbi:MAG: YaiO family outer membrane beta-barrel protein [Bacteroidota bacterium]
MIKKTIYLLIFLCLTQIQAQEKKYNGNPDASFEKARNLAFNKQRKQAKDTLLAVLSKYPDYLDVREFLGTVYSWEGEYNKARIEFESIFNKDKSRKSTWIAAINNEIWSDMPSTALEKSAEALKKFPDDEDLLYLKATAQENLNNNTEALQTLDILLLKNPENQKATDYKLKINQKLRKNSIGISSSVDLYSDVFDPMQYHTLRYSRQTKYGGITAKLNFNRRFEENGFQYEIDAYPRIAKGLYAYLNVGVSNSFLFPDLRYGAELFKALPKRFEASLGFRTLQFSQTTTIYTGSLSWYKGNSYFSFRPYITPGDSGTSASGTFTYRKYRSDADNYFGVAIGMGFSPEFNQFNFSGDQSSIVELQSQKINFSYFLTSKNKKHAWGTQFGVAHQEIIFDPGNYFWVYSIGVSWDLRFR